ncbi:MAG TPA: DPP IV N-terminal domain-containing protein [Mucilaginibacter sp.]|nr:DPP IV N-terminal domain-containing protein [Mucilaginibacter sp.]
MKTRFYHTGVGLLSLVSLLLFHEQAKAQRAGINWASDGYQYYRSDRDGDIDEYDTRDSAKKAVIVSKEMLTPPGKAALRVSGFAFSEDGSKVMIFTNTKRVWRYNTRGDYWVYDINSKTLKQLGKGKPESSLMFAKFSPDGTKAAYVSEHNIYVEDLETGEIKPMTTDGTIKLINGTFDWAYEEEFDCRDGFRWSPDSKKIAYWQINASKIKNYLMLNTTDSIYPFTIPVEYPVAGEDPSACKLGVVDIVTAQTTWMNVPGDDVQHYIPRMEWVNNSNELILEQLNRAQNESRIYTVNASSGAASSVYDEKSDTWIDVKPNPIGWDWLKNDKSFVWISEKDGWRHLYVVTTDGKEKLITKGDYDVIGMDRIDEADGYVYFSASPDNATQAYLYRVKLNGSSKKPERLTPMDLPGTHNYMISPNGKIAMHYFSNSYTPPENEIVSLPDNKHISGQHMAVKADAKNKPVFFKVKTVDGIEMDGWMVKPTNFDSTKKYPVVFDVYAEPAGLTVADRYGVGHNGLYKGSMADDGYIYMAVEGRGAPAPKGAAWRHAINKNIGIINIRDQAMAAKEILKWPFVDSSRIAVHGWSGGGSTTLNLLFQYPGIYKTGIAIAAVGWQLSYDNIYQERYMGVPVDSASRAPFIKGSPVTYAKNLIGNLLYVHGSGDDNVHYKNAEMLLNALIKYNRQFQFMEYPNRSHGIFEGAGTREHLETLFTRYLKEHCPPGGR